MIKAQLIIDGLLIEGEVSKGTTAWVKITDVDTEHTETVQTTAIALASFCALAICDDQSNDEYTALLEYLSQGISEDFPTDLLPE